MNISDGDSGIGSIGRIDHAEIHGGGTIPMHPHVNDEILSYFRSGEARHRDSEGFEETIGRNKLMLMKAGRSFYHEETMDGNKEPLEGLQIFIRPGRKDLDPEVTFLELEEFHSDNSWRLIASPTEQTHLRFSSETWIYDTRLLKGSSIAMPELPRRDLTALLYVYKGSATVDGELNLVKRESIVLTGEEKITLTALEDTEFVLFLTDEKTEIFKDGMYSGNQFR
ncbi:pirin family protein [Chitinophaga sp. CF418]|uniref:pirin family protein n=1 Tax=Chitinophaga sp. CF418 TaxID=1855287 RepID=UPI001CB7F83C|nr:pirin family protein [Chitinophaga sp. CF418]